MKPECKTIVVSQKSCTNPEKNQDLTKFIFDCTEQNNYEFVKIFFHWGIMSKFGRKSESTMLLMNIIEQTPLNPNGEFGVINLSS